MERVAIMNVVFGFVMGVAATALYLDAITDGCLLRQDMAYVVEHRACVPAGALVPAK